MPFRIFRLRTLTGANVVGLLVGASLFSMFFFISLYMQQVLGYSPIKSGFSYLPLALTIILSAGIASQLVTRIGFKPVLLTGLAFIAAGLLWFSQVSVGGGYVSDVLGPSLLAAVGLGFSFVTITIAAVSGVEEREAGLASGLINTSQQIGGALGLAVLATVANSRTDDVLAQGGGPAALPDALTEGFQAAFLAGAGFAVLGIVLGAGADPRAATAARTSRSRSRRRRPAPSSTEPRARRARSIPAANSLQAPGSRPEDGTRDSNREPWHGQSHVRSAAVPRSRCNRDACSAPTRRCSSPSSSRETATCRCPSRTTRPRPGATPCTVPRLRMRSAMQIPAVLEPFLHDPGPAASGVTRIESHAGAHGFSIPPILSLSIIAAAVPLARPHLRNPVAVRTRSEKGHRRPT